MPEINTYASLSAAEMTGSERLVTGTDNSVTIEELVKRGNSATDVTNTQTGASYTLQLSDFGKFIDMSNAGSNTVTVPSNASVAFPVGTQIVVSRLGVGVTTIVADGGVNIYTASEDMTIAAQYTSGILRKVGTDVWIWQGGGVASGGGGGDVTAPTVVSAEAQDTTHIVIVFSESVTVTTAGWSFTKNGSPLAITSVSGASDTWTFLVATMAGGDVIERTYNSATGDTVDTSANELVSFNDQEVTNIIGLVALTSPAPATAIVVSDTEIDFEWTNVANESGFSVQIATNAGFTTGVSTVSKGANVLTHSFTGLTPATHYWFRVKAVGDGITYADSTYTGDDDTTDAGATALKDLMAWETFHDPDEDVTTRVATDTFVVSIKDQMAPGTGTRDIAQATEAKQPKLLTAEVNGKAVIWLHGDAMHLSSTAASISISKPFTRCGFSIIKSFRASVRYTFGSLNDPQANDIGHYDSGAGQRHFMYAGNIVYEETTLDVITIDDLVWHHVEFTGDGSDKYYKNNVLQATGDAGSHGALQAVRLGMDGTSADAYVGIHCIYEGIMTSGERLAVYNAVKDYYNIP